MSRTNDIAFMECPLCDKMPYIKKICDHSAKVYCKGGLFNRHKELSVSVDVLDEDKKDLYNILSYTWNQLQFNEIKKLPIKVVYSNRGAFLLPFNEIKNSPTKVVYSDKGVYKYDPGLKI